jgi:RNA polymerase sigma factor (TIGR02999 family)
MPGPDSQGATALLHQGRAGDRGALDRLLPIVYDELSDLAHRALRHERADHTLQTRALVHEAYLRLIDAEVPYADRAHFLAVAARAIRRILVDHARLRRRQKRGGDLVRVEVSEVDVAAAEPALDVLQLHESLERLSAFDARKSEIVELHYFGGLSYDETAAAVGLSPATIDRELRLAKAWLRVDLQDGAS